MWKASTTSIQDKLSLLKSWLYDCKSNHPDCKPAVGQMPKRLIDVGSKDGHPTRLVMSKHLDNWDARYATLSYCWGDTTRNFSTMKDTVDSYSKEIPVGLIPPTYQDALTITRALKIPYLWIDSLCIVQDDYLEWQNESPRMQEIYSGSSLTIAATDAPDTSAGCFFRDNRSSESGSNKSSDNVDQNGGIFVTTNNLGGNSATILRMQRSDIRKSTSDSVLNTRGWVLQEMVLSHRTVHCMHSQLQWECRSVCKTEIGVEFDSLAMRHSSIPILPRKTSVMNKIWWKWMESYSQRRFTFPKDRLPAMAGIVQHYEAATGDTAILGLWEGSLHQDLLWIRIGKLPDKEYFIPHLLNTPSWSWLSCPAEISFDFWQSHEEDEAHVNIYDHVTLVDWDVNWTAEPLTSDIKFTRLVIDGPVREIVLGVAPEAVDYNPPYFDVGTEKPDFEKRPIPWRCAGQFDTEYRKTPAQYLCLLLRSRIFKVGERVKETFLMLEPSSAHQAETAYRRVGLGGFTGESRTFDLTARQTLNLV
jgi:hypothetical protein